MPVQINEMVIRANITEANTKAAAGKAPAENSVNKDEIIRECVEKVFQMLNDKNAR